MDITSYKKQQDTGTAAALPQPDATGSINMSGSAGKVALVNNASAITSNTDASVIDYVGFGSTALNMKGLVEHPLLQHGKRCT